ncbi:MAG: hypothetical protein WC846_05545 [Candidatus Gracilibacteria bacterium]|jgi:hypothetical protein
MAKLINFWTSADSNESSEKRVARFKQWFNRSRIGDLVKTKRYHTRDLNKRLLREKALKREGYRAEKERSKFYQ